MNETQPDPGSIEALNQMRSVREVKRLANDELAVAVESSQTYQDPGMQNPSTRVLLPEAVIEWLDKADSWELGQVAFYTSGEYQGCFAIRFEPVEGGA